MIRLSLPAYDPTQPLRFDLLGHTVNGDSLPATVDVFIRMWSGGFVGDFTAKTALGVEPVVGMALAQGSVNIALPDRYGLTGAEGWFSVRSLGALIFIHDVLVHYTPAGSAHAKAEGQFS